MPLTTNDAYDEPGSWGRLSNGWPEYTFTTETAHDIAWKYLVARKPSVYGSYVDVSAYKSPNHIAPFRIRFETEALKEEVLAWVRAAAEPAQDAAQNIGAMSNPPVQDPTNEHIRRFGGAIGSEFWKGPVTQPWTHHITFMQQTVLLTAVRGPDGLPKYGSIKMLLRWYRRCILVSSLDGCVLDNPYDGRGGSFMGPSYAAEEGIDNEKLWPVKMWDILTNYIKDLDAIPHHFQLHLLHSFQIVGYKHPNSDIREWFRMAYERLVRDMHLRPEPEADMDDRLGDDRSAWLRHSDEATTD